MVQSGCGASDIMPPSQQCRLRAHYTQLLDSFLVSWSSAHSGLTPCSKPYVQLASQTKLHNHDIDSAHTADVSRSLWPSTLCLIICVIRQSTLQRLRDHSKLTCSLLTSTLSALEVFDKSTQLLTYLTTLLMIINNEIKNWGARSLLHFVITLALKSSELQTL